MITAFAFFSLSIVLISCIVSIALASFSLVSNTRYFLNELVFSSSKALDERSKAMFEKLEAFSNIPDIQEDTLSYRAKIELLKNEIQMQRQRGWINFGIGGKNGILYRTDNSIKINTVYQDIGDGQPPFAGIITGVFFQTSFIIADNQAP